MSNKDDINLDDCEFTVDNRRNILYIHHLLNDNKQFFVKFKPKQYWLLELLFSYKTELDFKYKLWFNKQTKINNSYYTISISNALDWSVTFIFHCSDYYNNNSSLWYNIKQEG